MVAQFGALFEPEPSEQGYTDGALLEEWLAPPFSVLDTRQGYWKERRERWLSLGIQSELGRGEDLLNLEGARVRQDAYKAALSTPGRVGEGGMATALARSLEPSSGNYRSDYGVYSPGKAARREADQHTNVTGAASLPAYADFGTALVAPGTSIFDPVLCELVYRWWCPAGGHVLDPFAGGSVRGITAALLGHPYVGVDLSARQVEANREQAARIVPAGKPMPEWVVGDSRHLADLLPAGQAFDLVFTCPPYYDLEVYSDDPADLSGLRSYAQFLQAYQDVLAAAGARLLQGRFAVVVVSEIRDKRGVYRGLVPDTVASLEHAGLQFYNEAILINPVGSLAMRAGKAMRTSRKLGRTHQNVIVALRGDPDEVRTWDSEREAPPQPQQALWSLDEPSATSHAGPAEQAAPSSAEGSPAADGALEAAGVMAAEAGETLAAGTPAHPAPAEAATMPPEVRAGTPASGGAQPDERQGVGQRTTGVGAPQAEALPPWHYRLTAAELTEVEAEAERAAAYSAEQGVGTGHDGQPLEQALEALANGAAAEVALAALLGLPRAGYIVSGPFEVQPDVGGQIEVKQRSKHTYDLWLTERADPVRPYVLFTGTRHEVMVARGWLYGHEAKQQRWWRQPAGTRIAGYFVPQSELHPMHDLPRPSRPLGTPSAPAHRDATLAVHEALPGEVCATCGAEPSGTYRDGSPSYSCVHPAFMTPEHAAEVRQ